MKSVWRVADRRALHARLLALSPDRTPKWGRMSALQMLAHLSDSLRMTLGDLPVPSWNLPIRHFPLKQLMIYWLPFPKGVRTAPELIKRTPPDWASGIAELQTLLERFAARAVGGDWPDHPAFGRMSGEAWGVFVYRHMDHHLRQFGV